jgi:MFS family permease
VSEAKDAPAAAPAPVKTYPSTGYAWYMVGLLTVAYVLSFVDRYVLGLLIEPIKADLGLTDTQIGLLIGPAFAIFYATMGLPLGWMADKKKRTWIVGAGIFLWSAATVASGLAKNFVHMFIARMSIGVGEATLSPCAMSMISDSFPKEKRAKPIAFYTMALSLGAGIASLLSAGVLQWAKTVENISLPLVGTVAPWQFTFFVVGLPGLLLALVFLTLREPPRHKVPGAKVGGDNLPDMLRHVGKNYSLYLPFIAVFCYMTIIAYSQGWGAPLFQRTFGWDAAKYATVNAIVLLSTGPIAVNYAGWLSDRWSSRGIPDAPVRIALIGVAIIVVTGVAAPLMPGPYLAMAVYGVNTVGIALVSAVGVTALLNISPVGIRAQIVAFYYMCISLAGLLLGPMSIALLNDHVFGVDGIRYSMALVPFVYGVPLLLAGPYILRRYREAYAHYDALGQD